MARLIVPLLMLPLAGCAALAEREAEMQQVEAAQSAASCLGAGFAEGTDSYRLCMLIEQLDGRLDALERRLEFYELDRPGMYGPGPYRYWP
jgi:hypothetical protein